MGSGNKLRRLANVVICQLDLYGQLAVVEWKEEKTRLAGMLISLFLMFIFFCFLLLGLSGMVLVFSWDTPYRDWAMIALVCFYALGLWFSWYRFRKLASRGDEAFSETREEMAADLALLRKNVEQ